MQSFFSTPEDALSYTSLYNLLNFPAGTVTVSTVTEEDEAQLSQYEGVYGDVWDKLFVKVGFHSARPLKLNCELCAWQPQGGSIATITKTESHDWDHVLL